MFYLFNLIRTFLGLVKFYSDDTLWSEDLIGKYKETRIYSIRLIDFSIVIILLISLYMMGYSIDVKWRFFNLFLVSSIIFLIRDVFLKFISRGISLKNGPTAKRAFKIWLIIDLLFFVPITILAYAIIKNGSPYSQFCYGSSFALLLILSSSDIWSAREYYFG